MPGLIVALALQAAQPNLVLTGVGRWAMFADAASITRDGPVVRMRALQVAEADFTAAGRAYWGGWSWWRFDCEAQTGRRLDFASVAVGGEEGPVTAVAGPDAPLAPGGDAAELAAVACGDAPAETGVASVEEAVSLGRARLMD